MPLRFSFPIFILSLALFAQCGTAVYFVKPPDWSEQTSRDSTIQSFSDVLTSTTIFIDPGHGGSDRASIGPAEDVVEADVNLRVALQLHDYLRKAGANVIMSRESDQTVSLDARASQANVNNADIFVSIHHNAAQNLFTNYTTTIYHSEPGALGYKPSSQDLARYIQRDLAYVMGNPGPLASFDGTMSDGLFYPGKGLAVLRETKMTAVLVECGFFSSVYEEQRLKLPEFNEIEAWGIFRGIGKYLQAGIPVLRYVSPPVFSETMPKLEIQVSDRADIRDESIRVYVDGHEEGFMFNRKKGMITVTPANGLGQGYHRLTAQVRNSNGNSSAPFELYFAVGKAPVALHSSVYPAIIPPDRSAFSIVTLTAMDSAGNSVPDGVPIHFTASTGIDTTLTLQNGQAALPVYPGTAEKMTFTATNGPVRTEGIITTSPSAQYTRGLVMSVDGKPVANGSITLPGEKVVPIREHGEYIIAGSNPSGLEVSISAPGFFGRREAFQDARVQDPILLAPVARGVLLGKTFLLDLPSQSAIKDSSRSDVRIATHLTFLLQASGAHVISLHREAKTKTERDELMRKYTSAPLIEIGEQSGSQITIKANGLSSSRSLAERMMRVLPDFTAIGLQRFVLRMSWREEVVGMRQISVSVPSPGARTYEARIKPLFAWNIAWGIYTGLLSHEGYSAKGTKLVEVSVVRTSDGTPAPFVIVELNGALRSMTDAKGVCRFKAVSIPEDDVRVLDPDTYTISSVKTETIN